MKNKELFRIFTWQQIEQMSEHNLQSLKKELLLEFQLTDEPTVSFNGHLLDKNGIISIFEQLQSNPRRHIETYFEGIHQNFTEEGDLNFLLSNHGSALMRTIVNRPDLRADLLYKVSEIIADTITTASPNRSAHIKAIRALTAKLPYDLEEKAYITSLRYLRSEIESIKSRYSNPFHDNSSLAFEPEIRALVDVRFTELILELPEQFHFLAYEYALWCNDFIITLSSYRETKWQVYPIDSLLVIRDAFLIANQFYDNPNHMDNAHEITRLLENPSKLAKSWKKRQAKKPRRIGGKQDSTGTIIALIVAIVLFIRLALLVLNSR